MYNFKILPHTSDFRLKITGSETDELFRAALHGMNSVLYNMKDKEENKEFTVSINIDSNDSSMLLVDFLSEVLLRSHVHKVVFNTVQFTTLTETSLSADIKGIKVERFNEDIKAVTYTECSIKKNEKGLLETLIVFDI